MGSSSKKKKQKKKDFQKVKLKVGKKIPKGNVIDTTFKAKKIVIKEQLQNVVDGQNDGKIKRDIKEYLSKLKHNSMTIRGEAMKNLKESLTAFPDLIQTNLHALVESLMEVISDPFTPLRKQNITVLKLVCTNIQPAQVIPFFPIIVAHLRCGMTHMIHDVQADSLSIVDLLIDFFPQHLKFFSKHLLQDFLNQISNQTKTFVAGPSSQHKNGERRVLVADPSRKVTSLSWYLQVLHRLQNVLKTVLGSADDNTDLDKADAKKINCDQSEKSIFVSFLSSRYVITTNSTNSDNLNDFFEDEEQLSSVLSSIMPLLFQIWIEAKNLTSGDSLEVYQCIAEVIHMLWKIIRRWQTAEKDQKLESWFVKEFGKLFISYCMTSFPYNSGHFKSENKNQSDKANISLNAVRLNLLLCDILTCFSSVKGKGKNRESEHFIIVRQFLVDILNGYHKKPLGSGNADIIMDVMKKLFLMDNPESNEGLLKSTLLAFKKISVGSQSYLQFLQLLKDIVEQSRYKHLYEHSALSLWLAQIPIDLASDGVIPWQLVDIMRLVAPRGQADFLSNLQLNLPYALEKLHELCFSGNSCEESKRIITDMLYWVPQIDSSVLSSLSVLFTTQLLDLPLISHALQVLDNRYKKYHGNISEDVPLTYLSFLLSISFGSTQFQLSSLQRVTSQSHRLFTSTFHCDSEKEFRIIWDSTDCLVHQNNLMKLGLNSLRSLCTDVYLRQLLEGFLIPVLSEHTSFPLKSIQSLLLLSCKLWQDSEIPKNLCLPSLQLSMLFLEFLITEEEIYILCFPVIEAIMKVHNLSELICDRLLTMISGDLSEKSIEIVGKMTLIVIKSCNRQHVNLLENALQRLKNANGKVATAMWFVTSVYEISCKNNCWNKK